MKNRSDDLIHVSVTSPRWNPFTGDMVVRKKRIGLGGWMQKI